MGSNEALAAKFLIFAITCVLLEAAISTIKKQKIYSAKDSFCNLGILLIARLSQPLFTAYIYLSLKLIAQLTPFHIPENGMTTLAAVILTDFVYYFQHRFSHTNRYLWFFHEVHHSSRFFNLSTSFRLHWLGRAIAPLFFAPLVLLGFAPEQVTLFFVLNLFYQFILHTQLIGKIPLLEGILNTPSAHRVHHSRNKEYLNKNFGGIFMIWDRLFGTYVAETVAPRFGIIGRFESNNPFTVQFHKIKTYNRLAKFLNDRIKQKTRGSHSPQTEVPILSSRVSDRV